MGAGARGEDSCCKGGSNGVGLVDTQRGEKKEEGRGERGRGEKSGLFRSDVTSQDQMEEALKGWGGKSDEKRRNDRGMEL